MSLADIPRNANAAAEWETRPLAERMRPQEFDDYLGQEELLGPTAPLRRLIETDRLPSMMLWGPPGCGKTTLARLIAQRVRADFVTLSAVTATIKDVRSVVDQAKVNRKFQRRTILFLDEIHRFNKAQQDGFLPSVEAGTITLIGATTENPSFSIISPLLSRCRVFVLKPMSEEHVVKVLERGLALLNSEAGEGEPAVSALPEALVAIVRLSDGDARKALGLLEVAASVKRASGETQPIDPDLVRAVSQRQLMYDKSGEEHYNLISALHKTIRSSDPHGAVYWITRMLAAGEDPLFVARRLVRMASEDVGLADPFALNHAMECLRAYQALGSPEGDLALVQCAAYLALAPKSNAIYRAANDARSVVEETGSLPVPMHLRNAPTKLMKDVGYGAEYTYDHDAPGHFAPKQGLPDELEGRPFYEPTGQGKEKAYGERLAPLDAARAEARRRRSGA
ncbi:AAA family ATPase [bacterium]|nr:AAA family ATPase [bacterium]